MGYRFVTLTRDDDLDFVEYAEHYSRGVEPVFKERWIQVSERGKKEGVR